MKEKKNISPLQKKIERIDFLISFVALAAIVLLIYPNFLLADVPSTSMYPTLAVKELVLIDKIKDPETELEYGDIVTFRVPDSNTLFIKRLIGKPGDTIEVVSDGVIRNGEKLDEPYRIESTTVGTYGPATLGEDEFFFMGDNWNNSYDCRAMGPIQGDRIVGKDIFHVQLFDDPDLDEFIANAK